MSEDWDGQARLEATIDHGGRQRLSTVELPEAVVRDFLLAANSAGMAPDRLLGQLVRGYLTRRAEPKNDSRL